LREALLIGSRKRRPVFVGSPPTYRDMGAAAPLSSKLCLIESIAKCGIAGAIGYGLRSSANGVDAPMRPLPERHTRARSQGQRNYEHGYCLHSFLLGFWFFKFKHQAALTD
jgi:hypothetical protein